MDDDGTLTSGTVSVTAVTLSRNSHVSMSRTINSPPISQRYHKNTLDFLRVGL